MSSSPPKDNPYDLGKSIDVENGLAVAYLWYAVSAQGDSDHANEIWFCKVLDRSVSHIHSLDWLHTEHDYSALKGSRVRFPMILTKFVYVDNNVYQLFETQSGYLALLYHVQSIRDNAKPNAAFSQGLKSYPHIRIEEDIR
jgi:hypothetical protein